MSFRLSSLLLVGIVALAGCKPQKANGDPDDAPRPSPPPSAPLPVPRAAFSGSPVAAFADASDFDGKTPFEQAKEYEATGQLWMARLILEKKALGPDGTKDEAELLARVCASQSDDACVAQCSQKLGRKVTFDGGLPKSDASVGLQHQEPDTDAARARDLVLREKYAEARKILEPKLLDGKATRDEIRVLKTACERQGDRMCVALCDSKLK